MTRVVGAACSFFMRPETTYGTQATGNYHQLGVFSAEMGTSQPLEDVPVLGTAANRDPGDPFLGAVDTSGSVDVPINLVGFGHWLRLMFGAPVTSGSTNFTHNFDSGALTMPSNSVVVDYTSLITNRYGINTGVRGDSMEINFMASGAARARINLVAQGESRSGTPGTGTPALQAGANFQQFQGSVQRGGSALAQVTGATMRFGNGLDVVRTIRSDRRIEGADPTITQCTGSLTMRYAQTTDALKADAASSTPASLALGYTIGANQSLTFTAGRVFLEDFKTPIQGPTGIEVTCNWRAVVDTGTGRMLRATLANQTASYA